MPRIREGTLVTLAMAAMPGCARMKAEERQEWLTYQCSEGQGFRARVEQGGESAVLQLSGKTMRLPRAVSASGAKYSDGRTTFWQ